VSRNGKLVQWYRKPRNLNHIKDFKMTVINLHDGICGSGKNYNAVRRIINDAKTKLQHSIIAHPTKDLCDQSEADFKAAGYEHVMVLHADRPGMKNKVDAEFTKAVHKMAKNDIHQMVIITTHKAIERNANKINRLLKSRFNLWWDEVPQVDDTLSFNIKGDGNYLVDNFDVKDRGDNYLVEIIPRPGTVSTLEQQLQYGIEGTNMFRSSDAFKKFAEAMVDDNKVKFLNKSSYNTRDQNDMQMQMHTLLKPEMFADWKSTHMMAAHIESSMMYLLWPKMGVTFVKDTSFNLATKHNFTNRKVSVYYFSQFSWSMSRRDRVEQPYRNLSVAVNDLFKGEPNLCTANKDMLQTEWQVEGVKHIPVISHGLNTFKDVHNIAIVCALNNAPAHYSFMKSVYGVDGTLLKRAKALEVYYQSVMRTSLRDPHSTHEVKIVVPDHETATFLCEEFGANMYAMNEVEQAWGQAAKVRTRAKKEKTMTAYESKKASLQKKKDYEAILANLTKILNPQDLSVTTWEKDKFTVKKDLVESIEPLDIMYEWFKELHDKQYGTKEENTLFNGCKFKVDADTKGLDAVEYVTSLQLDFDSGLLRPERASKIFSDIKHLVWNSANNGKDNTLRYRIFIPLSQPVTVEIAEKLWDVLAERVRLDGWYVGRDTDQLNPSGLDMSKRTPSSFFYAPCRPLTKKGTEYTFFIDTSWSQPCWDVVKAIDNMILVDVEYIETNPVMNKASDKMKALRDKLMNPVIDDGQAAIMQQKKIDAAEQAWKESQYQAGTGNDAFFKLAVSLKNANLDMIEIERKLRDNAMFAHSPSERRNQIPSIKSSLKRLH